MFRRKSIYRPPEDVFIGAALRIVQDRYEPTIVYVPSGSYVNVFKVSEDRVKDLAILRAERDADGMPGEYESLADYALSRLVQLQKP